MLNIHITSVADTKQRYDTVGDYQTDSTGALKIKVSEMPDQKYEFLIAIHELVESYLCKIRNINEESIDDCDLQYESSRVDGDVISEPGNQPSAPYHVEHEFATRIEKLLAEELGVDWDEYTRACAKCTGN